MMSLLSLLSLPFEQPLPMAYPKLSYTRDNFKIKRFGILLKY
jgi:hypothetical protein